MKRLVLQLLVLASAAIPAFSGTIDYVCDTTDGNALPTSVCTTLQTTIAGQYATIFSNVNAVIYVQYGNIGIDVGDNVQFYNTVSYQSYYNALAANESGAADVTAVSTLPACTTFGFGGPTCNNPVVSGDGIALTSSLDAALGLSGAIGICTTATNSSCTASSPTCSIGSANCYNDIITISNGVGLYYDTGQYQNNEYDFFSIVEHETDEALGTSSCLENGKQQIGIGCTNGGTGTSAADLFRYSAPGTRSYIGPGDDQSNGSLAYFSSNGGVTNVAPYNNSPNGNDWGDWSTTCTYVQDAAGCNSSIAAGLNIANDGGVEIAALDAVGYNLTPEGEGLSATTFTPEPGTTSTFVLGLCALSGFIRRHRRAARVCVSGPAMSAD
jgi:hypothetical protein